MSQLQAGNTSTHTRLKKKVVKHDPNGSICGTWMLTGVAAQMVVDRQEKFKRQHPGLLIGKERALELLLLELNGMRPVEEQKEGNDSECPLCIGSGLIEPPKHVEKPYDPAALAKNLRDSGYSIREIARLMHYRSPRSIQVLLQQADLIERRDSIILEHTIELDEKRKNQSD